MFYGSIIAKFFGVLIVFILRFFYSILTSKKIKSFYEIWEGSKYDDLADNISYEMIYIFIGIIFIFLSCWFLMTIKL